VGFRVVLLQFQFQQLVECPMRVRRVFKTRFASNAAVAQNQNTVGI
jgi:hypothetical protein